MSGLSDADRASARACGTAARAIPLGPVVTAKLGVVFGPALRKAIAGHADTAPRPAPEAA